WTGCGQKFLELHGRRLQSHPQKEVREDQIQKRCCTREVIGADGRICEPLSPAQFTEQPWHFGEHYFINTARPFELLPVVGAQVLRNETAAQDLWNVDRPPSSPMNPYRRHEIFSQSDPVTADRFQRLSAKGAVRADRDSGSMSKESHLTRTIEPVRLLGGAARSE